MFPKTLNRDSVSDSEESLAGGRAKRGGLVVLGPLITRKERWGLTWRGWFLLAALALFSGVFFIVEIHSFLAPTVRVQAHLLVIEGWSPPTAMAQVVAEFRSGRYENALLVRPVLDISDPHLSGRYTGQWMSEVLISDGLPRDRLITLFPIVTHKDRTYHSALAVKEWLAAQHVSVDALDVATSGPHARRSRLLYAKAFGSKVKIGVIALRMPEYDPRHWWRTSEGVREVIGESIAYVYARFFFWGRRAD